MIFQFVVKYGAWVLAVSIVCLSILLAKPEPDTIVYPEKEIIIKEIVREVLIREAVEDPVVYSNQPISTSGDSVVVIQHDNATTGSSIYFGGYNNRWYSY